MTANARGTLSGLPDVVRTARPVLRDRHMEEVLQHQGENVRRCRRRLCLTQAQPGGIRGRGDTVGQPLRDSLDGSDT